MKKITLIIILLSMFSFGYSVTKTGTTSAKFLSIGVGARANGMGNAFVGIANDPTAMYWNPAGIAQLQKMELAVNYSQWLADMNYSFIGFVMPMGGMGTLGFNSVYMDMGEMDVTTEQYPEGTGETFSAGSYSIGISYARQLTDRFFIGGNAKFINENIMNCNANAAALDIGTLFITPFKGIRLGVSISNFGTKMSMTGDDLLVQKDIDENQNGNNESVNAFLATEEFDLPLLLRVGLSGDMSLGNLARATWAVDAMHPNDNVEYINAGVEVGFINNIVLLRYGMKSLLLDGRDEEMSFGGGLNMNTGSMNFNLDYAYQSYQKLGYVHKYTIRLSF